MSTAKGHEICVDRHPGEIVLWYLHRGEHDSVYALRRDVSQALITLR